MSRRLARATLVVAMLAATEALACPQCAGRDTYGYSFVLLLFSMIALPFSIVALVIRAMKAIRTEEIAK